MRELRALSFLRTRYPLAVLAGLFLTAAFPRIDIAGLAWIAPGLMVAAALGKAGGEAFRIGYVAGLAHYLSMLYWLLLIPYRWYGIPLAPALGWLLLSAVLAFYPATWVWFVVPRQAVPSRAHRAEPNEPRLSIEHPASANFGDFSAGLARNWVLRTLWALTGAAVWVALEMLLTRFFGGFPWDLLGVSQYRMAPLIQVASLSGVYGLSFLVIWVSLSLLSAGLMVIRRPTTRSVWIGEILLPVLMVALLFHYGLRHLQREAVPSRTVNVTLVQPSIPQTLIWNAEADTNRFRALLELSEQALTNQTDLLIWPESAVPKLLRYDQETFTAVTELTRRHKIWMILGSDDAEPRRTAANPKEIEYFNTSFLISPEGKLIERYIKRNLVIFGEYLPLEKTLPFLKYFTPIRGGFTAGTHAVQFDLGHLHAKTSVLICFEDVFPHLGRSAAGPDADFLVNLTNDGWFDTSAAQWQHAISALFRTVENGVPLVRCSNNGLTCWIDARGRIRQILRDARGSVYGDGFMTAQVPVSEPGQKHALTFYTRNGDCFGWGCIGVSGLLLLLRLARWWWTEKEAGLSAHDH